MQACVEVVNPRAGGKADIESLEDGAACHDCSDTGTTSNKRKARQMAMRRNQRKAKHDRLRMTGDVVTQEEEGIKDRGDRTNVKFVHDPTPLCLDSNSEVTSPSVLDDNDSLAQEAARTETACLSAGMLVSADEVSQTIA